MKERRLWTKEEDERLRQILGQVDFVNWPKIAAMLCDEVGYSDRTGKQCRERWFNHLNPQVNKANWSPEQERQMRDEIARNGNKWSELGKLLGNRTDNCVKNHYYSNLRKTIRWINKEIEALPPPERRLHKPIKESLISRLLGCPKRKRDAVDDPSGVSDAAKTLKNEIYCLGVAKQLKDIDDSEFKRQAMELYLRILDIDLLLRKVAPGKNKRRKKAPEQDDSVQCEKKGSRRMLQVTSQELNSVVKLQGQAAAEGKGKNKIQKKTSFGKKAESKGKHLKAEKVAERGPEERQEQKIESEQPPSAIMFACNPMAPESYEMISYIGSNNHSSFMEPGSAQFIITSGVIVPVSFIEPPKSEHNETER